MDMFMDKLAQKFAPQETNKSTTADTEELKRMRNRVAEYNECLDRLQEMLAENGVQVDSAEVSEKIAAKLDANIHRECVKVYRNVQAVVTDESDKLMLAIEEVNATCKKTAKRAGATLGLAIAAFTLSVISFLGVAWLLLLSWNIKLF